MKTIEVMGKSIEEAIENGLKELGTTRDKVEIEVIEQGSKGIFGRFGFKPAKVKIQLKDDYESIARNFLREVLDKMKIKCEIHIKDEDDTLKVNLVGPRMGILIGYRGETLDSLQYLLSLVVNKNNKENEYKKVILDTENYRKKREETLIRLADRLAYKVKRYNKSITLEPMNPYERRIIHAALQNNPNVKTHSEGEEPFRKVVVEPRI
ncbi:DNA-binding protein [Fervidicella metallireducens AeB]|uniref:RNA-binding protein KhpB n=1 Tax=Fervidicella metallireducens AeB TaxID=1403537 RepID=A0A017RW79_9CLOT|nr:RNA-binding cell elongation regulator Jag/EloR [Fervidicella metallireducens]EYE88644.1 DNA-binding protein [Fervidicella metallireducens AeB]